MITLSHDGPICILPTRDAIANQCLGKAAGELVFNGDQTTEVSNKGQQKN
jgi:hypothetical protein